MKACAASGLRRVGRDRQHVEPEHRAFLRHRIGDLGAFRRLVGGDEDVAGEADRDADLAVGEIGVVLHGVEVAHDRGGPPRRALRPWSRSSGAMLSGGSPR